MQTPEEMVAAYQALKNASPPPVAAAETPATPPNGAPANGTGAQPTDAPVEAAAEAPAEPDVAATDTPPAPSPEDEWSKRFGKLAEMEARAREALRSTESKRAEWEAEAARKAEEALFQRLLKDPASAFRERKVSDKEAILAFQKGYAGIAGATAEGVPETIKEQLERRELEARLEKIEQQRLADQQQYALAQARAADLQHAQSLLGAADDTTRFAKAEFAGNPQAAQEVVNLYYWMADQGELAGARDRNEVAKAILLRYDGIVRDRVQQTLSRHGHAVGDKPAAKAPQKPAPVAPKAAIADVSAPATRPATRPQTDEEWLAYQKSQYREKTRK